MKKYIALILLGTSLSAIHAETACPAPAPRLWKIDVRTPEKQKRKAVTIFEEDLKVQREIQELLAQGFQQLSVEAMPYASVFTDEGPASLYFVSAYMVKALTIGWETKFVTARVNTDKFGGMGAKLIDNEILK